MHHATYTSLPFGQTIFKSGLQILKNDCYQPVKKAGNNQRFHVTEILPSDLYGPEKQLPHTQKIHQC